MTYTLDSNSLGIVKKTEHRQSSNLDFQTMPLSDSELAYVLDYNGVRRVITIRGIYEGTAAEIMDNFITSLETLQNGNQSTVIYHSDLVDAGSKLNGNFNVKIENFTWTYIEGIPGKVEYTLVLYEGLQDV